MDEPTPVEPLAGAEVMQSDPDQSGITQDTGPDYGEDVDQ